MRSVVYQRALPLATRNLVLANSVLGEYAGLAGAAVLGIERVLSAARSAPSRPEPSARLALDEAVAARQHARDRLGHQQRRHEGQRRGPPAGVVVEDPHQDRPRDGDQVPDALRERRQLGDARVDRERSPIIVRASGKLACETPRSNAHSHGTVAGTSHRPR